MCDIMHISPRRFSMKKRKNRSDSYQWAIMELPYDYEHMKNFPNSRSIGNQLNPFQYDERIQELEDELKKIFWQIAEANMTERQLEVMKMRAAGFTQMEIAEELGVNQSSITKSINGNIAYSKVPGEKPKVHGGLIKKFRRIMEDYPRVSEILTELSELREEKL